MIGNREAIVHFDHDSLAKALNLVAGITIKAVVSDPLADRVSLVLQNTSQGRRIPSGMERPTVKYEAVKAI